MVQGKSVAKVGDGVVVGVHLLYHIPMLAGRAVPKLLNAAVTKVVLPPPSLISVPRAIHCPRFSLFVSSIFGKDLLWCQHSKSSCGSYCRSLEPDGEVQDSRKMADADRKQQATENVQKSTFLPPFPCANVSSQFSPHCSDPPSSSNLSAHCTHTHTRQALNSHLSMRSSTVDCTSLCVHNACIRAYTQSAPLKTFKGMLARQFCELLRQNAMKRMISDAETCLKNAASQARQRTTSCSGCIQHCASHRNALDGEERGRSQDERESEMSEAFALSKQRRMRA